jgi:FKBP-type peptidyl-prolyl cis-trans isomerase 2
LSNKRIEEGQGALLTFEVVPNDAAGQYQIEMLNAVGMDANQKDILTSYQGMFFNVSAPIIEISPSQINLNVHELRCSKRLQLRFIQ